MLAIMAEETRQDTRKRLADATSICLALDESEGRKVVRARCDTPTQPYRFDCVLGVMNKKHGEFNTVAHEVMEDYAQLAHKNLQAFFQRFFTVGLKRVEWAKRKTTPPAVFYGAT